MLGERRVGAVDRRGRRDDHVARAAARPTGGLEHLDACRSRWRRGSRRGRRSIGEPRPAPRGARSASASRRPGRGRSRRGSMPSTSSTSTPSRLRANPSRGRRARPPRSSGTNAAQRLAPMKPAPPVTTTSRRPAPYSTGSGAAARSVAEGAARVLKWRLVSRIYLSPPDVGRDERELLLDAFDSNWIAPLGPARRRLRARARRARRRRRTRRRCRAAPRRCTSRSLLLGVGPGDEVLVPDADVRGHRQRRQLRGRAPVFVDSDPATWNIDPTLLDDELDERARDGPTADRGLIAVDLYGQCADYDRDPRPLCARYGVAARSRTPPRRSARPTAAGRPGSFGAIGVFSFNGNKIITTSGGGMLVVRRRASWSSAPATWRPRRASRRRTTSTPRSASTTG